MFSENLDLMIIQITIPILNYDKDGIFYQEIYFETETSPAKGQVLQYLTELHQRDSRYSEYLGDWEDCIKSVNATKDWPWLGFKMQQTNSFVNRENYDYSFVNREDLKEFAEYLPITFKVLTIKRL
jgi:hypothetical protein